MRSFPDRKKSEYRTILGDPPPRVMAYPRESVVAEKMHAMAILGERNSRYKDFYDFMPSRALSHSSRDTLVRAVRATFERRATPVMAEFPAALSGPFYASEPRAAQWQAYVRRNNLADAPLDFVLAGDRIILFLRPIWEDLVSGGVRAGDWPPGGPWR